MIAALAGGVGGARLAIGLASALPPERLTIVVNTGDDFEHLGFTICPDIDTVTYTLAGLNNRELGWGRADETWSFMETLAPLGGETWFRLGDRDLALHVVRREALARGESLSKVTAALSLRLGVAHRIVPMSDEPVRTIVDTEEEGELAFQHYFVRRRCEPAVRGFRFAGAESAQPAPAVRALFDGPIEALVVCPSNPFVSIAPMLAVRGIRESLERRRFPVVAVSPIVGGAAVKGPAAKMMRELGLQVNAAAVAKHYGDLVDGWIVDERDTSDARAIEAEGKAVLVTDTMMTDTAKSAALAREALAFAQRLRA